MTILKNSVKRVTNTRSNTGRALVIEIRSGAIDTVFIREAGRRTGYVVPISRIYQLDARLYADAERAEKLAKKKAKRKDSAHV